MDDLDITLPANYTSIQQASRQIGFSMPSDIQTGCLLRTLIASKPGGRFLELGTGTGLSLAWTIEGMDKHSAIVSIDNNETYLAIARKNLETDTRVTLLCADANEWIMQQPPLQFDLIFADAWPGKYALLAETLQLLKHGGLYIIDDMLPQPNWPAGHENNVAGLITQLESRTDINLTELNWSTGIIIVTKTGTF